MTMKQYVLAACLSAFVFIVIGGGLHLNPGGAFLAALTWTPLLIHISNRWLENQVGRLDLVAQNGTRPLVSRQASRSEEELHMFQRPTDDAESTVAPVEESASC